jgi:flagellum-specific peptidoglycan hydrolase FlgJ
MAPTDFYRTYIDAARANERASGVPALFTLAQSALETGWGRHAPGNMMFGIKAGPGWAGKKQLCVTREVFADARQGHRFAEVLAITPRGDGKFDYKVRDWFRAYDSALASFADHARMLRANARYAKCFETGPEGRRDPREFARRIAAAGYATDPGYAASLIAMIDLLENVANAAPPPPREATADPRGAPSPERAAGDRGLVATLLRFAAALFQRRPG